MRIRTACVHGAGLPRAGGEPLVTPLVRSTNFHLDAAAYAARAEGYDRSYVYTRETNPTIEVAEARLATLEGAERTLLFASGMAALHACSMPFLKRGDQVVCLRQIYGGTRDLLDALLPRLGCGLEVVDVNDTEALRRVLGPTTRMVFCESISNPLTAVTDLPRLASLLRDLAPRAILTVDATLATPIGQRPLELGADMVFHSASKYLGGHSDLIGGAVSGGVGLMREVFPWRTKAGGCMDPQGAWLLDRGMKTLALRVRAQTAGAQHVARFLAEHPRVVRVHYAGLEGDPYHSLACQLLQSTGGLLSFIVRGGDEEASAVLRRLTVFSEAASLGGVESLASRPRDLSQAGRSADELRLAGIAPGMLRLSVGIEDPEDLTADLEQALAG